MSHIFSRFNKDLRWDNFTSSKLNVFGEKVSNDTYLKIFDNNLMETVYKPKNFNNLKDKVNGIKGKLEEGIEKLQALKAKLDKIIEWMGKISKLLSLTSNVSR